MITLFPDQTETISKLRAEMRTSKSVLLQSPTGSGKTAMAIWLINAARQKNKCVVFTVPRRELMKQTSQTFDKYDQGHSYIAAGRDFNPYSRLYIGMIDTMTRRINSLPDADMVVIDESHFGSDALNSVIRHYKAAGAYLVGLSATPWKLSGKGLGCWYDSMVEGPSIRWLIDNKRLSDYRFFRGKTQPDLSKLHVTAGDYAKGEVASYMEEQGVIIGDCVNEYRTRAMGRLHVVRCASIKHSQMTAQAFRDAGIPAMHVDGTTPDDDMRQIIRAYARREILVLTFCDLLNFGFDLAQASGMDVCIESGSDMKPSKSLAGQMQYWGRMLRYKPHPAIIMDHVNNWQEHGLPCAERKWSLEDRNQGKKSSERVPPTRQCLQCFHIHTPSPTCPECGYVYIIKSREIEEVSGELEEIDPKAAILERKKEQGRAQSLEDLIAVGRSRGMKYPSAWASKVLSARMAKQMRA
jgi:superfamily II DNA or RNA helicase